MHMKQRSIIIGLALGGVVVGGALCMQLRSWCCQTKPDLLTRLAVWAHNTGED